MRPSFDKLLIKSCRWASISSATNTSTSTIAGILLKEILKGGCRLILELSQVGWKLSGIISMEKALNLGFILPRGTRPAKAGLGVFTMKKSMRKPGLLGASIISSTIIASTRTYPQQSDTLPCETRWIKPVVPYSTRFAIGATKTRLNGALRQEIVGEPQWTLREIGLQYNTISSWMLIIRKLQGLGPGMTLICLRSEIHF